MLKKAKEKERLSRMVLVAKMTFAVDIFSLVCIPELSQDLSQDIDAYIKEIIVNPTGGNGAPFSCEEEALENDFIAEAEHPVYKQNAIVIYFFSS